MHDPPVPPFRRPTILIVHPGSLGDVLLSLMAIRSLKQAFPDHERILIAQTGIGTLFYQCGEVHHFWPLEGPMMSYLLGDLPLLPAHRKRLLGACTHAIMWMNNPDGQLQASLRKAGVDHVLVCSTRRRSLKSVHYVDRYLETLEPWGIQCGKNEDPLEFAFPSDRGECVVKGPPPLSRGQGQVVLMVHPGSGSRHKCCSAEFLGLVIKKLACFTKVEFLLVGGPADEALLEKLEEHLEGVSYKVLKNHDLFTVAIQMRQCQIFLGHDSGLTHLAANLGVRTIALFGPTNPCCWAPRQPWVTVLQGSPCFCKDWNQVQNCPTKSCLDISVSDLLKAVENSLEAINMATT